MSQELPDGVGLLLLNKEEPKRRKSGSHFLLQNLGKCIL